MDEQKHYFTRSAKHGDSETPGDGDRESPVKNEATISHVSASLAFSFTPEILKSILDSRLSLLVTLWRARY